MFERLLQILISKRFPPSATIIVDYINLLIRYIEQIGHPGILFRVSPGDKNASFPEGSLNDQAPLFTLADSLDSSLSVGFSLGPALALRILAEKTIK